MVRDRLIFRLRGYFISLGFLTMSYASEDGRSFMGGSDVVYCGPFGA